MCETGGTRPAAVGATGRMEPSVSASPDLDILLPLGTYHLAPTRSLIAFTTRHFFGLGRVTGRLAIADGEIHVADPLDGSSVIARITTGTLTSGLGLRDAQVRSSILLQTASIRSSYSSRPRSSGQIAAGQCMGLSPCAERPPDRTDRDDRTRRRPGPCHRDAGTGRSLCTPRHPDAGMAARHLDVRITVVAVPA
jgi:hypothetical protein